MRIEKIKIDAIQFASNRAYGGEGEIKILAADMKENGLINPITIKELTKDSFSPAKKDSPDAAAFVKNHPGIKKGDKKTHEVVAGRRRIAAAILLGWTEITSCILEGDEINRAEEIAGSENINRLAMHPLDEAKIFAKMLENGQTIEELAKRYDRKPSAIWQRVQLLGLNDDIKIMFRNGQISLHSAAALKGLSEKAQEAFYKQYKNNKGEIEDHRVIYFISNLGSDKLYGFLRDKQCAECKTRTFFTDKNLFPEMDNKDECCFNHACYLKKWEQVLTGRIKSIKGERKSHIETTLIIVYQYNDFFKIAGKKMTIDGIDYKVLPHSWSNEANAKDKDAKPCFEIGINNSDKLEIVPVYWKEADKQSSSYRQGMSSIEKRKRLKPIVDLLPQESKEKALDAMNESKRISPSGLSNNVRDSVFWKIINIKSQEFNDPKNVNHSYKEIFLKKYFSNLSGNGKKIFEMFVGKTPISDIAKQVSDKIFALLLAMEWAPYDMPEPEEFAKGKQSKILEWVGLPVDKLKPLYQEEIQKRIPKEKPEAKKPVEKKQAKPKPPAANKTTATKKTPRKKLPSAKHIKAVNAAKGKGKK